MIAVKPTDSFFHLSGLLCGDEELPRKLSDVYYLVFNNDPAVSPTLKALLDKFEKINQAKPPDIIAEIKSKLLSDTSLRGLVLSIIKLWYLGVIKSLADSNQPLKGDGFYFHHEALIWKVSHAHPAGLSGGYYGYWAYKPEN